LIDMCLVKQGGEVVVSSSGRVNPGKLSENGLIYGERA
jgi:hypothetical protein